MVRLRAGKAGRRLDCIESADIVLLFRVVLPLLREVLHVADIESGEDILVDREDAVGLVKLVDDVEGSSKSKLGPAEDVVFVDRFVLVPLRVRHFCQKSSELVDQSRGNHGSGQEPDTFSARGTHFLDQTADLCHEFEPGLRRSAESHFL